MDPLRFTLDGVAVELDVADPKSPALAALREQLGVLGVKAGCSPQGSCGACTVLVDGKPRLTCTLPVKSLAGKAVGTLASVPEATRARIADAFVAEHAAQCGYCTPALVLSVAALVEAGTPPSDEALDRALAPHVCRCTGYAAIRRAVARAATGDAPPAPAPEAEVVLGERPFVDELVRADVLHGALVFGTRGRLVQLGLDATRAADGVRAVVVLIEPGAPVPFDGAPLAAIAADSRAQARAAAAAAVVEVEATPPAAPAATLRVSRREGDVEVALGTAADRRQVALEFAAGDAVPLEPEAALAEPDGAGVRVYAAVHDARGLADTLTAELGVPVRVVTLPSGGSYGARRTPTVEGAAARLALGTGRPVKLALDHEDGTRLRARRPGARVEAEVGLDAAGEVVALRLEAVLYAGARVHDGERLLHEALEGLPAVPAAAALTVELHQGDGAPTGVLRGGAAFPLVATVAALLARPVDDPATAPLVAALGPTTHAAVVRTPGGDGAQVLLRVADGGHVEVQCNVPELGQGRDRALVRALVASTGLPAEVFSVEWGDSGALAAGGEGPVGPAATDAGRRLAAIGGRLAGQVGRRVEGRSERAADGFAAASVSLDETGGLAQVVVAVAVGDQDLGVARSLAEGGAAMGVGYALCEEVPHTDAGDEVRFRYLGTLKSKLTPRVEVRLVPLPGGPREVDEAACVAVGAAIVGAVVRRDGGERVPLKASNAARAVGVRPPRQP